MPYIYDGILTSDVIDYVLTAAGEYPYAIEVSDLPDYVAFDKAFAHRTHTVHGENCMGQAYIQTRKGIGYCYVQKNFGAEPGGFLFLPDREAYDTFRSTFPERVVNPSPFKTALV